MSEVGRNYYKNLFMLKSKEELVELLLDEKETSNEYFKLHHDILTNPLFNDENSWIYADEALKRRIKQLEEENEYLKEKLNEH